MSHEAEYAVMGAALVDPSTVPLVNLSSHHFGIKWMQEVWADILHRSNSGEVIDPVLLSNHWPQYAAVMAEAAEACVVPSHAPEYAKHVRKGWQARQAAEIGEQLIDSRDTDQAIRSLIGLSSEGEDRWDCSTEELKRVAADIITGQEVPGLPTGFKAWDDKLGGLKRGELIVIAGRPSMGKTALATGMAERFGQPVLLMSGEMDRRPVMQRILSSMAKVPLSNIIRRKLSAEEQERLATASMNLGGLVMNDKSEPSLSDVNRAARKAYHEHGICCVIVDYLQRMKTEGDRRHEAVGANARGLKTLARELNIPVIALAQVKRAVDERPLDKRQPTMADISDSSEVEKEADVIATIYRTRGYLDECSPEQRQDHTASIAIVKNRNGPKGRVITVFKEEYATFEDLA